MKAMILAALAAVTLGGSAEAGSFYFSTKCGSSVIFTVHYSNADTTGASDVTACQAFQLDFDKPTQVSIIGHSFQAATSGYNEYLPADYDANVYGDGTLGWHTISDELPVGSDYSNFPKRN